jgi:hypothetical protein
MENKERITFTIKKETHNRLKSYCDDGCVNKSRLIERLVEEYLNGKEKRR